MIVPDQVVDALMRIGDVLVTVAQDLAEANAAALTAHMAAERDPSMGYITFAEAAHSLADSQQALAEAVGRIEARLDNVEKMLH